MSSYFDFVIMCYLPEDIPARIIDPIRWLCDPASDPKYPPDFGFEDEAGNFNYPFLAARPGEEVVSSFEKRLRYMTSQIDGSREVYEYGIQYAGRNLPDVIYDEHLLFIYWLAKYLKNGFVGYYKEEHYPLPRLFYVRNHELVDEKSWGGFL